jgi:tRNA threonylcarbamoyladenosine biosynthesis protein TsaB
MAFTEPRIMLAIETSQREGSVALRDARDAAHPETHEEKLALTSRHDDDLLPAIDRLLTRLQLRPIDLRGGVVAVSIGPGGFTGLRIAISTAKMFGEALSATLIAVPSALVAAEGLDVDHLAGDSPREVLVALATKAGSAWVTRLTRPHAREPWSIAGNPALMSADMIEPGSAQHLLADEHFPALARDRLTRMGTAVMVPRFSASGCLRAAMNMLRRGETISSMALSPLYPRVPEAVTLWRMRRGQ